MLTDIRDEEGEKTAEGIPQARYRRLDVTEEGDWARAVEQVLSQDGRLDVLVNNAARLQMGAIERTSAEDARRVIDVNLVGPFLGMRAVIPAMKARDGGSIVNVASLDGLIGMNGVATYAASKWGLRGLARSAALELGRDGIRVNTVCPAGGNPEMYGPWMERLARLLDATKAYTEDRAIPGEAPLEAIAEAVLFLASDASRHVTGVDLPVDGGASAGHYIRGFNEL